MIYYPLHKFFIYDGEIKPNSEFRTSENAGGVYEVLRVLEGTPLFLEEHLDRFFTSAQLAGKTIRFSKGQIEGFLNLLTEKNEAGAGNILLSCKTRLKALFISHKYPELTWYESGVTCGLLTAERKNPNAKVFQTPVRQQADELMEQNGFYEVLLIDYQGRVTEGSRSNVFFVDEGRLITPPGHEVLLGITRQKTIQLAKNAGFPLFEKEVLLEEVPGFQAAFITGTSPKILPLSRIGKWNFNPQNHTVQQLRNAYDDLISSYIMVRKQTDQT